MALQLFKIASTTVESPVTDITFSSIPSGYTDLLVFASVRSTRASQVNSSARVYFNGSTSGYTWIEVGGNGTTAFSNSGSTPGYFFVPATGSTALAFSNSSIYIPNYTGSNNKSYSMEGAVARYATTMDAETINIGLWSNTSAITSITIQENNVSNLDTNSTFTLYGIL